MAFKMKYGENSFPFKKDDTSSETTYSRPDPRQWKKNRRRPTKLFGQGWADMDWDPDPSKDIDRNIGGKGGGWSKWLKRSLGYVFNKKKWSEAGKYKGASRKSRYKL